MKKLYILISKTKTLDQILQANKAMLSLGIDYLVTPDGRVMVRGPWYLDLPSLPPPLKLWEKPVVFDQDGIYCPGIVDIWVDRDSTTKYVNRISFYVTDLGSKISYSRQSGFEVSVPYQWKMKPGDPETVIGLRKTREVAEALGFKTETLKNIA